VTLADRCDGLQRRQAVRHFAFACFFFAVRMGTRETSGCSRWRVSPSWSDSFSRVNGTRGTEIHLGTVGSVSKEGGPSSAQAAVEKSGTK
jgi:hypothetical protein